MCAWWRLKRMNSVSLEQRVTHLLPVLYLCIAGLLSLTPLPFAGSGVAMPSFALITVFFWGLLRPVQLPAWALFAVGLVLDAFSSPALGTQALVLLLMRSLVLRFSPRFSRQTIWFFWGGFWLMSLPCWLLFWLITDIVTEAALSPWPALLQWAFTALCYPILHLVFARSLAALPPTR